MIKIDELKEPPKVGESYLVPCIISLPIYKDEEEWTDYNDRVINTRYIYPVINHRHSDVETGQNYEHYHVDYRFIKHPTSINKRTSKNFIEAPSSRFNFTNDDKTGKLYGWGADDRKLEYFPRKCYRTEQMGVAGAVKRDKLKHHCIYKGKCPHRGYDLSQEIPVNGIITCPLHGLEFDAITKKLIK